ncbi:MAG: TetR/AcrR family transcriptional regulator [Candidatus Sericytochromatia bacterium]|nr:TetR/AcrR family transcriptional regulator [Candidatus Sericytochromatia bacterium]
MRYPQGHKAAVKARIVHAAAKSLRQHGLDAVSIPALMQEVGMTHGGFYAHFQNRDDLVSAAIQSAADDTAQSVFAADLPWRETLERYLSMPHLAHPEEGCVLAALGTDGARQSPGVQRTFADVAVGFLRLADRQGHSDGAVDPISDEALARAATMVGAVMLGRLVQDEALAARILAAAKKAASS